MGALGTCKYREAERNPEYDAANIHIKVVDSVDLEPGRLEDI